MARRLRSYLIITISLFVAACANEAPSPSLAAQCPARMSTTEPVFTAARFANEDWEKIATFASETSPVPYALTPRGNARPFSQGYDVELIPEWNGTREDLEAMFVATRDETPYRAYGEPDFPRRASWLYPYDGCASRAAHVARSLVARGFTPPAKVYAFGNLRARTQFQRGGSAFWWYHTAPGYRFEGVTYVFDPSVDSRRLLTIEQWLVKMSKFPEKIRVAVCDPNGFDARSVCRGGANDQDADYRGNIRAYLPKEWENLVSLGFDPVKLLGEEPPWTQPEPAEESTDVRPSAPCP